MTGTLPLWLEEHLRQATSARAAAEGLLFHGTVEPFSGGLKTTCWERLCWFAEAPEVAQSYCPEAGTDVLWSTPSYSLDQNFVPHSDFDAAIFNAMGFDIKEMEAERDHYGRMCSYRLVKDHPSNRDARTFLEGKGYVFEGETCWIKVRIRSGQTDEIMPDAWRIPGRLFIHKRPADLRLYDLASKEDGGLTGRQWMKTDLFEQLAQSGNWDGIVIDDVHQSRRLGHFGHRSVGLFQPTIDRLDTHVVACVHCDPYDVWMKDGRPSTTEFEALFHSVHQVLTPQAA